MARANDNMIDPWAPVHHEDAPEPKKPQKPAAEPVAAKGPEPPDSTRMMASLTVTSPMDLQLAVPNQLVEDISALAASQRELAEHVASLMDALNEWTGDVQASMQSAQQPVIQAMMAAQNSVIDGQRALGQQVQRMADAQPEVARNIAMWSQSIEATIQAPRRVTLERGADGMATGAVSSVVKGAPPPSGRMAPPKSATPGDKGMIEPPVREPSGDISEQIRQLAEGQREMQERITSWSSTIEQAIRAPRRVQLQRGADGLATGAVSTIDTSTQPPAQTRMMP